MSRAARRSIAGLCAVLVALAGAGYAALTGPAAAAAPSRPFVAAGTNLLLNPDAETGECTTSGYDAMTVPGWTVVSGSPDSVCYGAIGFPRAGTPGAPDAGKAFFSGGATGNAIMQQRIDLTSASRAIDAGGVQFLMSGWLGGWAAQDDRVGVRVEFDDASGALLGSAQMEPVTNSDRRLITELVRRTAAGDVPIGAHTAIIAVTFTWTAGETTDGYADGLSFSVGTPMVPPKLTVPKADVVPSFDHVFFVFMENENYGDTEAPTGDGDYIVHNPAAKYLNRGVAYSGSLLSQMYATTHPSDPNYLAVTGGSTFGWTRNLVAGVDKVAAPNIGDLLDAKGETWAGYADGMAYPCDTNEHDNAAGGYYIADDEPFLLYADVVNNPQRCAAHNKPLSDLAEDLRSVKTTPNFVWFAANDVDNMEDGGVATGDQWLSHMLPMIMSSPAWTKQRSLLIVSWDEGRTKAFGPAYPNHIATYVLASQGLVKDDYVSELRYTDYSLGATIEDALGVGPLTSNDRYAAPLSDIWTTTGPGGSIPPGAEAALREPTLREPTLREPTLREPATGAVSTSAPPAAAPAASGRARRGR